MTAGALTQIQHGMTDRMWFLSGNPQITHFKAVYKKYTNFAMQYITNLPYLTSGTLSFDQDMKVTFQIPRDGDCIRDIYLALELPDIYSDNNYQFQWIKRIGEYIIRDVTLQIDTNQAVDKQYGEWLHIYSELNYDEGKKRAYYKMIGNIPELYDPSNAAGNNGIYPNTSNLVPSIINRKLYIPLAFWFNKLSSQSFPLIATQKTIIYITFTFRKLQELYTVIDNANISGGTGTRVKPTKTTHYIGNFLFPVVASQSSLFINPRLEINNIFLDNEERKIFALSSVNEYLITQVQLIKQYTNTNMSVKIDLTNFNKPVSQLAFLIRRSDMEDVNDWSNYTNWNVENIPPYSNGYINPYGQPLTINSNNIIYYKNKNLLKSAVLRILGEEITTGDVLNNDVTSGSRLNGKDFLFYNLVQSFTSNKNVQNEGIYTYSFALDNTTLQPTGAINFSTINNKDLLLNLTPINQNETMNNGLGNTYTYNYTIYVFAINYDILKIMGGMVGIMSAN